MVVIQWFYNQFNFYFHSNHLYLSESENSFQLNESSTVITQLALKKKADSDISFQTYPIIFEESVYTAGVWNVYSKK